MPRTARIFGFNELNHCIIRGVDRTDIFFDTQDRRKFLSTVIKYKGKYKVKIGTYTLMQNHVHFITQGGKNEVSKFFQSLQISYSAYFNKKYDRTGHLFENRYKNRIIESERYLRNVVRYIHFNPEKAGICQAEDYEWSGYKEFFKETTWMDREIILSHYSNEYTSAIKILKEDHNIKLSECDEDYAEYEMINKLTDEQIKAIIDDRCKKYEIKNNYVQWNKIYKEKIIKDVLKIKGISILQLSRVTGISRGVLNRLKNK